MGVFKSPAWPRCSKAPLTTWVVNDDLPRLATDYTHRIGRTCRAGATGLAVSFVTAQASGPPVNTPD